MIYLLHIVQLPSDTSAAYCAITFWYIWCILYNYLPIHLLHILQLPSGTSAAYCTITFWYICCTLYDYSCFRYHLLHTLHYLLITSPVQYTISWHHLLHTVLSYYGWCSSKHDTFLKFGKLSWQIYAKQCSALIGYFKVKIKTVVKETSSVSVIT